MPQDHSADYIVIGAGSSGAVMARRLSDAGHSVLLLEAGPRDLHPFIHVPAAGMTMLKKGMFQWVYKTEPSEGIDGRSVMWPRGRVLGGSSSINGMNFVRGNPADFDRWAQKGCQGWSYDDVLPSFRSMETYRGTREPGFRGADGPLVVEDYRTVLDATKTFVAAAVEAGHAYTPDINGEVQEGVGFSQMSRAGRFRRSTSRSFLWPIWRRANLKIEVNALVQHLTFDGTHCTGCTWARDGIKHFALARKEVIVAAGSIASPQLLQRSGIGPAGHLRALGIPVVADRAEVGQNLADHFNAFLAYRVRGLETLNAMSHGWRFAREAARWTLQAKGALTFGATAASVFFRSRDGLASPDMQLLFMPMSFDRSRFAELETVPGISVGVCPARPHSRGSVLIRSRDPEVAPVIQANYLAAEEDRRAMVAGFREARRIFQSPALARYVEGEIAPGVKAQADDDILAYARAVGGTAHHQVGTCRMGGDDASVVDARLRVRGVEGLRVADGSIMPDLVTGNTNAACIMIGERGAALILEDARAT